MSIFKRKKVEPIEIPKIKHEHTWKDMPWYLWYNYEGAEKRMEYKIMEPYICITCGERKNVQLESRTITGVNYEQFTQYIKDLEKQYKKFMKPRPVVEDMINNILLVKDTSALESIEKLRGSPHIGVGSSSRFRVSLDRNPKLELDEDTV